MSALTNKLLLIHSIFFIRDTSIRDKPATSWILEKNKGNYRIFRKNQGTTTNPKIFCKGHLKTRFLVKNGTEKNRKAQLGFAVFSIDGIYSNLDTKVLFLIQLSKLFCLLTKFYNKGQLVRFWILRDNFKGQLVWI